jgi:TetR/AcrR family transcriptional regulator
MDKPNSEQFESTEQRIFEAAHEVFTLKGMAGAKMQEIADRAGINKALLHYYYRSKEKLFEAVVKAVIRKVMPKFLQTLESELPLLEKLEHFVDTYIDVIRQNPFVPLFVISEMNKHPDRFFDEIVPKDLPRLDFFYKQVEEAVATGLIRPVAPRHLVINAFSLCVFPIIARPMARIILGISAEEMNHFLDERKKEVKSFLLHAIRP